MNFGKHDWRALTLFLGVVALAIVLTWWVLDRRRTTQVSCTLDARICPDGSAVGRTPPLCEFAPCPSPFISSQVKTLQGKVICLPHRDTSGEQTLECAFGLETASGNYSLKDSTPDYRFIMGLPTGEYVSVTGQVTLEPSSKYDTVGSIMITELSSE